MHKVSIAIFKYEETMITKWITHQSMTIYHAGMCSIWIEWLCIPRWPNLLIYFLHYLNRISQSTKLTVNVRYDNQVMLPHIQKIENWNESIMLLFFNASDQRILFYSILSLVAYFFARSLIFALIFSFTYCTFGCDAWCSVLCWDSCFCLYDMRPCVFLSWIAPSWWYNSIKSSVLSPRPLRACMDSIAWSSKNMCFWCGTKFKIMIGLHGGGNKISCLSDPLTGWFNFP